MANNRNKGESSQTRADVPAAEREMRPDEPAEMKDAGLPVIIAANAPADHDLESAWEPGIVEVVFKDTFQPEDLPIAAALSRDSRPPENVSALVTVLHQYGVESYAPSFASLVNIDPALSGAAPAETAREYGRENFVTFYFPPDADTVQIAEELRRLAMVERAVPVPKAVPPGGPKDEPLVGNSDQVGLGRETQWYIFRCLTNLAWEMGIEGEGVVIADIDFGFLVTHQDLRDRIELKHNSYDQTHNVSQGNAISHGTAVLGLAGAAFNGLGMTGIAFRSSLWAIQANTGTGLRPSGNRWANAIDFVRTTDSKGRRKVIILEIETSKGGNYEMVPSVNRAIKDAIASNIVVCVAAGNGGKDAEVDDVGKPIPVTNSILAGATEYAPVGNRLAAFSNYGPRVVVSAPGDTQHDLTCSSSADDAYRSGFGGTSGAVAKVAGAVALMLGANPKLSHWEVKEILEGLDSEIGTTSTKPAGRFLDVNAAVLAASSRTSGARTA